VCFCAVVMPVRSDPVTLCHNLDQYQIQFRAVTVPPNVLYVSSLSNHQPHSYKCQRRLSITGPFLKCDLGGLDLFLFSEIQFLKWGYSLPKSHIKGTSWLTICDLQDDVIFQFFHTLGSVIGREARMKVRLSVIHRIGTRHWVKKAKRCLRFKPTWCTCSYRGAH